ncbi:MAG: hypothetical protein ACI8Y4_004028 [Candidatus Poriferisodalaceae bacterium]
MSAVLGCSKERLDTCVGVLRGKIAEEGLTDHQAASIAAVVKLSSRMRNYGTELDRFLVKLAEHTPEATDWIVVRQPRIPPQIIRRADIDLHQARKHGYITVFDPKTFLDELTSPGAITKHPPVVEQDPLPFDK